MVWSVSSDLQLTYDSRIGLLLQEDDGVRLAVGWFAGRGVRLMVGAHDTAQYVSFSYVLA